MRATRHRLDPLLRPRSIALVGVSRDSGRRQTIGGNTILQALIDFGYDGRIDLVHPSGEPVAGRPSSRSIGELPATPDALILTLPAAAVPAASPIAMQGPATRADACAGLQQAMRATPHTRIDAGLGQINLGYHQQRYASACDLLDPYRNLAIAAEILHEQHTPGEDWLLAIGRYHRPAGGEPAARYRRSVSRHLARVQGARPTTAASTARQETSP